MRFLDHPIETGTVPADTISFRADIETEDEQRAFGAALLNYAYAYLLGDGTVENVDEADRLLERIQELRDKSQFDFTSEEALDVATIVRLGSHTLPDKRVSLAAVSIASALEAEAIVREKRPFLDDDLIAAFFSD